jgi:hypothetical protein
MPAAKPKSLSQRNDTKADRQARTAAESSVRPKTELTIKPPASLSGHKTASVTWRRVIELQNETKAAQDGEPIITSFDVDLLVKYCLLEEEVIELAKMRADMHKDWDDNRKIAKKIKPNPDTLKVWVNMWDVVNAMFQRFQGMDARLDGKRKLLLAVSMSLYLTPRSRAGVAPPIKDDVPEKSNTEKALE